MKLLKWLAVQKSRLARNKTKSGPNLLLIFETTARAAFYQSLLEDEGKGASKNEQSGRNHFTLFMRRIWLQSCLITFSLASRKQ